MPTEGRGTRHTRRDQGQAGGIKLKYLKPSYKKIGSKIGPIRWFYRRNGTNTKLPDEPHDSAVFLAAYLKIHNQFETPEKQAVVPGTVDEVIQKYLGSRKFSDLAANTQKNRRAALNRFSTKFGDLPAKAFMPTDVYQYLLSKGPSAAQSDLKALRDCFRHGKRMGLCENITDGIELDPVKTEGFHTWTSEELSAYQAHWPVGTRERLAFDLLMWTGQRRSDVVSLGWQNVREGVITLTQVKTNIEAYVPLTPPLRRSLDHFRGNLTFLLTIPGSPFTAQGFGAWFKKCVEATGLPDRCRSHGLRKAFVCYHVLEGRSTHEIMAMGGWRSAAMIDRYARAYDRERIVRAMVGGA